MILLGNPDPISVDGDLYRQTSGTWEVYPNKFGG